MIRRLEDIEASAWGEFFRSPRAELADRLKIRLVCQGGAVVTIAGNSETLALNRALNFGAEEGITSEDIEWLKAHYERQNVRRFFVTIPPDIPGEVVRLLEAEGFYHYNEWAKLYRDTSPLEGIVSDLTIRRIDEKDADEFAKIFPGCIDWGGRAVDWMKSLIGRKNWYHYMAFDGDKPAGAASMFVEGKNAWIGFAGTYPEFRGRGAQAGLTRKRIADAAGLGAELVVVETGVETAEKPMPSYRNMKRFGFIEAYQRKNYIFEFKF